METGSKKFWTVTVLISLFATAGTYVLVESGVFTEEVSTKVLIESGAERVRFDNLRYRVENVDRVPSGAYRLGLKLFPREGPIPEGVPETRSLTVAATVYREALEKPVLYTKTEEKGSETLAFLLSPAVGGSVLAILMALRLRSPETLGKAASILLENDEEDARVRDVEILTNIIKLERFTIPQIMDRISTSQSQSTTYRTVEKLIELGLVGKTEEERAARHGRGKPSTVYKYLGP